MSDPMNFNLIISQVQINMSLANMSDPERQVQDSRGLTNIPNLKHLSLIVSQAQKKREFDKYIKPKAFIFNYYQVLRLYVWS